MPRYRITIEYDGTRYSGWQVQRGVRTVQGALIEAARRGFGDVGEVTGSGRTDAGVHALAQVAHIDLRGTMPNEKIAYALNDNLPHDVNVLAVRRVDSRFHARHDAVQRSYLYQISRRRTSFAKEYVWWVRDRLDVGAIRRCAIPLTGMHDYSSFTDQAADEGSTIVKVSDVSVGEFGPLIVIRIRGSHFLRKMVRRIVGAMVDVARGKAPNTLLSDALERPAQRVVNQTAPPSGLFLEAVAYAGERLPEPLSPAWAIGPLSM